MFVELDRNTIDGLLQAIDEAIVRYDESAEIIEKEYSAISSPSQKATENYWARKEQNEQFCDKNIQSFRAKIKHLCNLIRMDQPVLLSLGENNINMKHGFPRSLVFGKYRVIFNRIGKDMDFHVPRMLPFPLNKPVRIDKSSELPFIHQLLLRLIFALPIDKQEYYFFDPRGLGSSVRDFNRLFLSEKIVPQQKVMMSTQELKDSLKHVELYIRDLYTHTFNAGYGENWEEYNRYWYERNERRKMLPYRVFVFMDVPLEMDQDSFRMFRNLIEHNGECGILVLFSCDEAIWVEDKDRIRSNIELELIQIVKEKCVHPTECFVPIQYQRLMLSSTDETMPTLTELRKMTEMICDAAKSDLGSMFSFTEMLSDKSMFSSKSDLGLEFPIGYDTTGGSVVNLKIDDRTPHYLIGGATGSGKSNLLHNLIVSACWKYNPSEVKVYLLDFKEGVEFSQYALPDPESLPHAVLVATEADTEYGVTVLRHLDEELSRRATLFKEQGCKDIRAYRAKSANNYMPRILVIIDEFQVLFDSEQKVRTLERMNRIAKQGRSAGVHLVLATQSLKGIGDFTTIATQFSGRIALKCAAEDSKMLLGGISSNNEAASELEIPYAIINTTQGNIAGNIKLAVPEAKSIEIRQKLGQIHQRTQMLSDTYAATRIFSGQSFPSFPERKCFISEGFQLTLGKSLSYEEEILNFNLRPKLEYNLLLCGHSSLMKAGLLQAILLSADYSEACDEIIYVGEDDDNIVKNYIPCKTLRSYGDALSFAKEYQDIFYDKRFIVVLDNRNLTKEAGFPASAYSYSTQKVTEPEKIALKKFWDNANPNGSHFVAFFDSGNRIKVSGMPLTDFTYRIAYELNDEEMNIMLGSTYGKPPANRKDRAFLIVNQEIQAVFRPFIRPEWRS